MNAGSSIQLSDLLESYMSQFTPGFQEQFTAKKEFAELSSDIKERLEPGRGKYFKHQRLYQRFLRAYDDLLILDNAGVGKSCSILGFTEYVIKEIAKYRSNPYGTDEKVTHYKRMVVLVKGKNLKNEFRNQLICRCSDGHYETSEIRNEHDPRRQDRAISRAIRRAGYTVYTYGKFAKMIEDKYDTPGGQPKDEALEEDFSDTIFWIDEAQSLLIETDERKSTTVKKKVRRKRQTYDTIWRVFHVAKRCKRILSTATPMINSPREFASLLNLILPADGSLPLGFDYKNAPINDIRTFFPQLYNSQIDIKTLTPQKVSGYFQGQIPPTFNWDTAGILDLEPYLRGRVGFVRAADTGAIPVEQGEIIRSSYMVKGETYVSSSTIEMSTMSEFQSAGYFRAKRGESGSSSEDLYTAERQASNFVYPDGYAGGSSRRRKDKTIDVLPMQATAESSTGAPRSIMNVELPEFPPEGFEESTNLDSDSEKNFGDTKGFARYIVIDGPDQYRASDLDGFRKSLTDISKIREMSCKFANIATHAIHDPGNVFIYSEYVEASGAVPLSLCLQGLGLERFTGDFSMFQGITSSVNPFCASAKEGASKRRPKISPKPRYALLTSESTEGKIKNVMEAMNSYENRHGDYVKILISSRVAREGINVNNVLQIHLVGAEWNESNIYQALSRGLRATSHEDILDEIRQNLIAQGLDPYDAAVEVKIYKHGAEALGPNPGERDSIDLRMYNISEYKDRSIKRIMRIAKQCAVTCFIHYGRNVRSTDIDYSPECDYDVCAYKCVDEAPTSIDYSTYDILYTDEIYDSVIDELRNYFSQRDILTLNDIETTESLSKFRVKYITMTLERLITEKIPVLDRFGFNAYVRESRGTFYLDRDYPTPNNIEYDMSYYAEVLLAIREKKLSELSIRMTNTASSISALNLIDHDDAQELEDYMLSLDINAQIAIVEEFWIRRINGDDTPLGDAILRQYRLLLFELQRPSEDIKQANHNADNPKVRRGRKTKDENLHKVRHLSEDKIKELLERMKHEKSHTVYVHTIDSTRTGLTNFATMSRLNKAEGEIRLLDPTEYPDRSQMHFRTLQPIENKVYDEYIQALIWQRAEHFNSRGIYGRVDSGIFRIVDRTTQSEKATHDSRSINTGRKCDSFSKEYLIGLLWYFKAPLPNDIRSFSNVEHTAEFRQQMINKLRASTEYMSENLEDANLWPFERLAYYIDWFENGKPPNYNKTDMCEIIESMARAQGDILE